MTKEEAITELNTFKIGAKSELGKTALDMAIRALKKGSNVGHWIPSHIPESILDECSECGFSCGAFTFNYCPNCGTKMESEVEKND